MSSILFIGGGNMASCIIGGMIANGFNADNIMVSEPGEESRQRLEKTYGIKTMADNQAAARQADLIVLAVKPQIMRAVATDLALTLDHRPAMVSVAAGIPLSALENWLGNSARYCESNAKHAGDGAFGRHWPFCQSSGGG